ncbi:DNA-binding protein [Candidatus Woesearchaeota archaeon]|nr:DNA-binding protein [Candidatus Woesearchaeota archaeon]
MNISELKERQGNVDITVKVKDIGEVREFNKFGKIGRVANATVSDDSGDIKLTLWNEDIDKIKVGDTLKLTNGFVNVFQGEKQLTTGKFGKLEVVSGDVTSSEEKKEKKKSK